MNETERREQIQFIEKHLEQYFDLYGDYKINNDMTVSIDGTCNTNNMFDHTCTKFFVTFKEVTSTFNCGGATKLKSLTGCPKIVGNYFSCSYTSILSLRNGPDVVLGDYVFRGCDSLRSFSGIGKVGEDLDGSLPPSNPSINLLDLLKTGCRRIELSSSADVDVHRINEILNRYVGSTPKGMLACAAELIEAGFDHMLGRQLT